MTFVFDKLPVGLMFRVVEVYHGWIIFTGIRVEWSEEKLIGVHHRFNLRAKFSFALLVYYLRS